MLKSIKKIKVGEYLLNGCVKVYNIMPIEEDNELNIYCNIDFNNVTEEEANKLVDEFINSALENELNG